MKITLGLDQNINEVFDDYEENFVAFERIEEYGLDEI